MQCLARVWCVLCLQLDIFSVKPFAFFLAEEFAALRDSLEHSKSYEQLGATADVWMFQFQGTIDRKSWLSHERWGFPANIP